jgi:glycosyltransferase involved in cell wall biosynthesis
MGNQINQVMAVKEPSAPLVSIGMPLYNGGEYLELALRSLLTQTYENFELVICDNASTDGSEEICKSYADADSRIEFSKNNANLGSIKNFKKVFELSSGEYFVWASCHDLWSPNFLEQCVRVLQEEPSVALCYAKSFWIDTVGNVLGPVTGHQGHGEKRTNKFCALGVSERSAASGYVSQRATSEVTSR